MLSIRPVVSSTKLFAIAIILSTSAAAAAEAKDRAAALALFFCICIALALPARQCTPCLPGRSRHLSRIPPPLPPFSLLACSPLPNVLMCGKRWCCCSCCCCCCHEAFATFLLRAKLRKGMQRRRSHPFRPLIHSLIHSVVYSDTHATFIHTNSRRRSHECIAIVEEAEAVWGVSGNMFVRMWKINEKIVNKSAEIKHGSLTHTDTHTHVCKDTPEAAQTEAHSSLAGAVSAFFCTIYVF